VRTLVRNKRFLGVMAFAVAAFLLAFPMTAKATPLPWTWEKASPDSWGVAGVWSGDMMTGFVADMQEYNGDLYVSGLSNNGPVLWRHNLSGDQSWEDVTPTDAIGASWNLGKMTVGNDKLYITAIASGDVLAWMVAKTISSEGSSLIIRSRMGVSRVDVVMLHLRCKPRSCRAGVIIA